MTEAGTPDRIAQALGTVMFAKAGPPTSVVHEKATVDQRLLFESVDGKRPRFNEEIVVAKSAVFLTGNLGDHRPASGIAITLLSDRGEHFEGRIPIAAVDREAGRFRAFVDISIVDPAHYRVFAQVGEVTLPSFQTLKVVESTDGLVTRSLFQPNTSYSASDMEGTAHEAARVLLRRYRPTTVLDCGCWDGSFAASLKDEPFEFDGVEFDEQAAVLAKRHLRRVIWTSLEEDRWVDHVPRSHYDAVLLLDVLEHLTRPDRVLSQVTSILAPNGRVIISVPNVAHLSNRISLLSGRWEYTDSGLLDRTHLRFFTGRSLYRLVVEAGLTIEAVLHTRGPANLGPAEVPSALKAYVDSEATLNAYQFVVAARSAAATKK